jgi:hypothetical protein
MGRSVLLLVDEDRLFTPWLPAIAGASATAAPWNTPAPSSSLCPEPAREALTSS